MEVHKLKILPIYFNELWEGNKNFEIRKDDRSFKKGDILDLMEYDQLKGEITKRGMYFRVTYILRNAKQYGLKNGYCILGIKNIIQ